MASAAYTYRLNRRCLWNGRLLSLWVCLWLFGVAQSQTPIITCNPQQPQAQNTGPTWPQLPNQYKIRVEANIIDKNYSMDAHEFYDGVNNRAALLTWNSGIGIQTIFSYSTNELISVVLADDPNGVDDSSCVVTSLSNSSDSFYFGVNHAGNTSRMFSTAGALRFGGNTTEVYIGKSDVRGIHCDGWESCVPWPSINANVRVRWYFSDKNYWDTAIGLHQVPLRCNVTGQMMVNGALYSFQHLYELTEFRVDISNDNDMFLTPPGTYCPGRKNSKPLPQPNPYFGFSAEIYQTDGNNFNQVSYVRERYDSQMQLVSLDYVPGNGNPRTRIITDFGTGVEYTIVTDTGACTVGQINPTGFSVVSGSNPLAVQMRNPSEFFFSDNTSYVYEGQKQYNDILCDVWVGNRQDYPPGAPGSSTWEWYFATANWTSSSGGVLPNILPVGVVLTIPGQPTVTTYVIYDYDEEEPDIWRFDIGPCFNTSERQEIKILANVTGWKDLIISSYNFFETNLVTMVSNIASISPIRVANVRTDFSFRYILIAFTIIDNPPLVGNVPSPRQEQALAPAVAAIYQAINGGNFSIGPFSVDMSPVGIFMPTEPYTDAKWGFTSKTVGAAVRNVQVECTSGYSSGAMAGMAIGMLILGLLLTFGILIVVYKVYNAPFLPQRFEMAGKDGMKDNLTPSSTA